MKESDVFADLPTLRTPRLLLRKLRRDDAAALFAYASDPEVSRYVVWETHRDMNDSLAFLEMMIERYHNGQVAVWAFEELTSGRLIGTGGFGNWSIAHARAEIGYTFGRADWNRGFATEALRGMIAFGFERMALNRIEAYCDVRNIASARVMEKAGMTREGTLRRRMVMHGAPCDVHIYSVLRAEWEG